MAPACLRISTQPTLTTFLFGARRGTDTQLPFECPADFVFHIPLMDAKGVPYRVPNFLQRPQVGTQPCWLTAGSHATLRVSSKGPSPELRVPQNPHSAARAEQRMHAWNASCSI